MPKTSSKSNGNNTGRNNNMKNSKHSNSKKSFHRQQQVQVQIQGKKTNKNTKTTTGMTGFFISILVVVIAIIVYPYLNLREQTNKSNTILSSLSFSSFNTKEDSISKSKSVSDSNKFSIPYHSYPTFDSSNNIDGLQNPTDTIKKDKIEYFLEWFEYMGGQISPRVTLDVFSDYGGYGLKSISDEGVEYMQELFTVPYSIIFSTDKILKKYEEKNTKKKKEYIIFPNNEFSSLFAPSNHQGTFDSLEQQDILLSFELMVQCSLGRYSHYYPYMQMLPSSQIPRLDTFTSEELSYLQDDYLEYLGFSSKQKLKHFWMNGGNEKFEQMLEFSILHYDSNNKKTLDIDIQQNKCTSFKAFHKYITFVSSRAMVLNGIKYLSPLADMINYAPQNNQASSDTGVNYFPKYHSIDSQKNIIVRADRNVFSGNQIMEDYGPVDNSLFLEAHGFVPSSNPNHCAIISQTSFFRAAIALKSEIEKDEDLRIQVLQKLSFISPKVSSLHELINDDKKEGKEMVCVRQDFTISSNKRHEALVSILANSELDHIHKCHSSILVGEHEYITQNCIHYPNSLLKQYELIKQAAHLEFSWKQTSLEQDLQIKQDMEYSGRNTVRTSLALDFRIKEKRLLHHLAYSTIPTENNYSPNSSDSNTDLQKRVEDFKKWLNSVTFPTNLIEPVLTQDKRIGVIATQDLKKGDIYLSIPNNWTIHLPDDFSGKGDQFLSTFSQTVYSSNVDIPEKEFVMLLFHLMHEYFTLGHNSVWWPYLNLLPSPHEISNIPMLLPENQINQHLSGSDIRLRLLKYQQQIIDKYNQILLSELGHDVGSVFGKDLTFENFQWAHYILDSRSIWWNRKRHLVPLLDLVNCGILGNEEDQSIHSTVLSDEYAVTKSSHGFSKGQPVLENYGQPNYIYFLYHGFILSEENHHDCALYENSLFINRHSQNYSSDEKQRLLYQNLSKYNFHSTSPSFCIKDLKSLDRMADFVRIKYDLFHLEKESHPSGLSENTKEHVKELLQQRILRYDFEDEKDEEDEVPYVLQCMRDLVKSERRHFRNALHELDDAWF